MSEKMVEVRVSETVYRRLQRAAELTYRSVDEILTSTIEASLPSPPDLPDEIAETLAAMHTLSDDALWSATKPSLSLADQTRLRQLNHLAGQRPLTSAEKAEQESLITAYHHAVLRRAQALAILAQRGHPIKLDELPTDITK